MDRLPAKSGSPERAVSLARLSVLPQRRGESRFAKVPIRKKVTMNRLRIVAFLLAAMTSACGGGSDSGVTTPTGQGSNPPPPGSAAVTIQDFSYNPQNVTIKVGTTVRWTNAGPSAHTTVSDAGLWNSGTLAAPGGGGGYGGGGGNTAGGTFQFSFSQAGTFTYHCSIHPPTLYPGFTGTITVTP